MNKLLLPLAPSLVRPFPVVPGGFQAIVADPAWKFSSYGPPKESHTSRRDIERHYRTMTIDEIKALPVQEIAARDCHLFLWATGPLLPKAFEVMTAWGFTYSAMAFVWIKLRRNFNRRARIYEIGRELHTGLGYTTRKNAEFVLLGRRGNPKRLSTAVREIIIAPRREHSRKPDEMYERVQQYCAGPYIELFSRESRENFTTWGDEAEKFDVAA